jgi:hypothetical protein
MNKSKDVANDSRQCGHAALTDPGHAGPLAHTAAKGRVRRIYKRNATGQQMAEFAGAIVILVLTFFLPLLDLAIMPIRYFMAHELIQQYARRLSHCETLTQAYAEMNADPSLQYRLIKLGGCQPKSLELHLMISTIRPPVERLDVVKPKTIPKDWLPDARRHCEYILEVVAAVEISPACLINTEPKIMGLSKPVPITLRADSPWENLGRNPVTKAFFLNE